MKKEKILITGPRGLLGSNLLKRLGDLGYRVFSLDADIREPENLEKFRDSNLDVGRIISELKIKRKNYEDIFFANIQRCKESIRVLEEFSKLKSSKVSAEFKVLRYQLYELEKKASKKIKSLLNS